MFVKLLSVWMVDFITVRNITSDTNVSYVGMKKLCVATSVIDTNAERCPKIIFKFVLFSA